MVDSHLPKTSSECNARHGTREREVNGVSSFVILK